MRIRGGVASASANGPTAIVSCGSRPWRRHRAASPSRRSLLISSCRPFARHRPGMAGGSGFCSNVHWLVPTETAVDRATDDRAAAYLDELKSLGNRDYTIVGRFLELETALRIMLPHVDFVWLRRPGGVPIRARLAMERR